MNNIWNCAVREGPRSSYTVYTISRTALSQALYTISRTALSRAERCPGQHWVKAEISPGIGISLSHKMFILLDNFKTIKGYSFLKENERCPDSAQAAKISDYLLTDKSLQVRFVRWAMKNSLLANLMVLYTNCLIKHSLTPTGHL